MLDAIDRISGQLRDAACDPDGWAIALDSINAFVDGSGAILLSVDERLRHAPASSDVAELVDDYFRNGWYANDRREGCRPLLLQKGIAFDHEFLDQDEIEGFHADFLARHDCKWFAGLGANLDGDLWCLALQRSAAKGPFLDADLPRLAAVRDRLEAAATLARSVSRRWLDGAFDAYERQGSAALVLDRAGRIIEMNAAARAIVLGPATTRASAGRRHDLKTTSELEAILRSRLLDAPVAAGRSGRIPCELDGKMYALAATPLTGNDSLVFSRASTLVRIDPQAADPLRDLTARYRLTRSEARVAMALAGGLDVEAMADAFNVSTNTIRAQLKVAYAKTETGSQAKLVSLIAQIGRSGTSLF